jgi:DNA polymerase-4
MGRSGDLPRTSGITGGDDTGCDILHVDMDAFFASVEIRKRPELAGRPVVVGGGHRGVVAAASYEARRYGVRSAMPMGQALRLCPQLVVLPPDRAAYTDASAKVFAIFADVTPLVEPLSLDEAFLDVSGARKLFGTPTEMAQNIRTRVHAELQLRCSVGVAPNKFLAKLASAACKPDGLRVVPVESTLDFLHPLPVAALWGVGRKTGETLHRMGIRTVGELARTPTDAIQRAVGVAMGVRLSELAWGHDVRLVDSDREEKSISAEQTYDLDLTTRAQVVHALADLADELGRRLAARGFGGRTIGVKVRFADFAMATRVRAVPHWVSDPRTLLTVASELYDELGLDQPRIRLLGIRTESLRQMDSVARQLDFDGMLSDSQARAPDPLAPVLELARSRFGKTAILRGSAVRPGADRASTVGGNAGETKS